MLGILGKAIGVYGAINHLTNFADSYRDGNPNWIELGHGLYDVAGVVYKISPTGVILFIVGDYVLDAASNYYHD